MATKAEKIAALKAKMGDVRIGGKGSMRRKRKTVHKTSATEERRLQTQLKKFNLQSMTEIEEVNMFKTDGNVLHFTRPKGSFL
jgi:nascent polypeptide-associated complex subunit beta